MISKFSTIAALSLKADSRGQELQSEDFDFDFGSFDAKHRQNVCSKLKIEASSLEVIRPCTSVQAGMIAQFIRSEGELYYNSVEMHIQGTSNLEKLRWAWTATTSCHQLLRTGFASTSDPTYPFAMLTYHPDETNIPWKQQKVDYELEAEAKDVLESLHKPAWRLSIQLLEKENVISVRFAAHHALFDAYSLSTIFHNVAISFSGGDLPLLGSIEPILSNILIENSQEGEERKRYWNIRADKLAMSRFPNLCPLQVHSTKLLVLKSLCSLDLEALKSSCKSLGITLQALFQASWGRLLLAYTGEDRVSFGTVFSGRNSFDSKNMDFPTVVTLPTSAHLGSTNLELVKALVAENATLFKHQFTPLKKIQNWTGHGDRALFDTILVYQKEANADCPWEVVQETAAADVSQERILDKSRANGNIEVCCFNRDNPSWSKPTALPNSTGRCCPRRAVRLNIEAVFSPYH